MTTALQPSAIAVSPRDGDGVVADCAAIMTKVFHADKEKADHAEDVAAMADKQGGSPEVIAAAYLHDVAEDATPENQKPAEFLASLGVPENIAGIVLVVTRHVNGKETYAEFISRILSHGGHEGEAAVAVKFADLTVNRNRCVGKPEYQGLLGRYEKALRRFESRGRHRQ